MRAFMQALQQTPAAAILLCAAVGMLSAPLITVNIGQTRIPDGDSTAPLWTAVPAAIAGFLSGALYAVYRAKERRQNHQGSPQDRWAGTLLLPALWGLGTALFAAILASFVILLPFTVPLALIGSVMPGQQGIIADFPQPLRALATVPPLAWAPLIAAVMRAVSSTRLGTPGEQTNAERVRRALPLALPLILAASAASALNAHFL